MDLYYLCTHLYLMKNLEFFVHFRPLRVTAFAKILKLFYHSFIDTNELLKDYFLLNHLNGHYLMVTQLKK